MAQGSGTRPALRRLSSIGRFTLTRTSFQNGSRRTAFKIFPAPDTGRLSRHSGSRHDGPGESRGGISLPGAPSTVLEPFGSHGSRCSAVDVQHAPMCEQSRVCAVCPSQPVSRALWPRTQTFELVARPTDQVGICASECWMECRPVKVAVVVDPASGTRVVFLGRVSQGRVAPSVQGPSPDCLPDCFQRLWTGCGQERDRVLIAVPCRLPRPERTGEEVERLVREVALPVRVLAVGELRLPRVRSELASQAACRGGQPAARRTSVAAWACSAPGCAGRPGRRSGTAACQGRLARPGPGCWTWPAPAPSPSGPPRPGRRKHCLVHAPGGFQCRSMK